jgi:hypothetical protein
MAGFSVEMEDGATPMLALMISSMPDYAKRALRHSAYETQKAIKEGIKSKAPGGQKYAALMPARKRRALESVFDGNVKRSYSIFGKLRQAIGFEPLPGGGYEIGWLSPSAAKIGRILENGMKRNLSEDSRRGFWAAGVGVGSKHYVEIPARPTIGPLFKVMKPKYPGMIEERITGYLQGAQHETRKKRNRKYKVYS